MFEKAIVIASCLVSLIGIAEESSHAPEMTPTPSLTEEVTPTPTPQVMDEKTREATFTALEVPKEEREKLIGQIKEIEPQESPTEEALDALFDSIPQQIKVADSEALFELLDLKNGKAREGLQSRIERERGSNAWKSAMLKCTNCHGESEKGFPEYLSSKDKFEKRLDKKDPEAGKLLKDLNTYVANGSMLKEAGLASTSVGKEFSDAIKRQYDKYIGPEKEAPPTSPLWMIDPSKKDEYGKVLAAAIKNIPDPEIRKLLSNPDVIHDPKGAPPQTWAPHGGQAGMTGARPLDFPPAIPVAKALFDEDGNWRAPFAARGGFAMAKDTQGLDHFFMIRFPRDEQGNLVKGVTGEEVRASTSTGPRFGDTPNEKSIYASFPKGTTMTEVLYTRGLGADKPVPVDILTREKEISDDGKVSWRPNGFRMSQDNIRKWAEEQPSSPSVQRLLSSLDNPKPDRIKSELGEERQGGNPFVVDGKRVGILEGTKSEVKGLAPDFLRKLYDEVPMTSVAGRKGEQLETTDLFSGSHRGMPINGRFCSNCHDGAGENFGDVFDRAGLPITNVSAYGQMAGSDGVLSHNPFDRASLDVYPSTAGNKRPPGMIINKEMRADYGEYFETYDPEVHLDSIYKRLRLRDR